MRSDNRHSTMYTLIVFDASGGRVELGSVKIGEIGMGPDQKRPSLKKEFDRLGGDFFSLGQSTDYYEHLGKMEADLRNAVTGGLRDVVADPDLWLRVEKEDVTQTSLTRHVSTAKIKGQFLRLLNGAARLTPYAFSFAPLRRSGSMELAESLSFRVTPESNPPTNVHAIIGRNGVGKTRMLYLMTKALVADSRSAGQSGKFTSDGDGGGLPLPFAGLVTVLFSAFDEAELPLGQRGPKVEIQYEYIGLREFDRSSVLPGRPNSPPKIKSPARLTGEFVDGVRACLEEEQRMLRWRRALDALQADPIFKGADVTALAERTGRAKLKERAAILFEQLSSGHKIVLLTITRLVEVVDERTLVLIDEPESHLHPPLLAAFIRALSDLLVNRNGVPPPVVPVILHEISTVSGASRNFAGPSDDMKHEFFGCHSAPR